MEAARRYVRTIEAGDDEARRALRALGALLLGVGVLVLAYRRTNFEDPWGDFPVFLLAFLPALFLYGGGFLAARDAPERQAWHGVFLVFGLLFVLFSCFQFLELIDGDPGAPLNVAWTFALVAALGAAAAVGAGVRFGMLAAGIAFLVAWLALWDEILGDDFADAGTVRGLSMLAAGILVAAGIGLHWRRNDRRLTAPRPGEDLSLPLELLTAGGLAFLFGSGILSATGAIASYFVAALAPLGAVDAGGGFAEPSLFWDLVLLVGSLGLVGLGTRFGVRGPAYVGAVGLAIFVVIVGLDLDDSSPAGDVVGWPLLILVLAAVALVASVLLPSRTPAAGSSESP